MNRALLFDSPLLLGFEHTRTLIERAGRIHADVYPPYNIEDRGGQRLRITIAVAGFAPDQLQVAVEDSQLTVIGRKDPEPADAPERDFLHRGIAQRGFQRSFVLAEGLEVEAATLADGLLSIDLHRPRPESPVRVIPIRAGG